MDASPIDCIFTVSRATARTTAYLRCRRPRGDIIHCKYAVVLFGGRARARRSEDGTFSPSWGILWCSQGPQEKVLHIEGGHQNGRELDSLHFYRAPWPPRSERQKHQRASEGLFRKSLENQRVPRKWSPARIPSFLLGPVTTSMGAKTRSNKNL